MFRKRLLKIEVALCFRSERAITDAEASENQTGELDSSPVISQPREKRGSLGSRFSRSPLASWKLFIRKGLGLFYHI